MKSVHLFTAVSAFSLATAVILGAWNAHGMESLVTEGSMDAKYVKTFHTGVEYQFYMSLGMLMVGLMYRNAWLKLGRFMVLLGTLVFSGSLYLLALNQILGEGLKIMGAVAPFGGLLLAAGWMMIGVSFLTPKKHEDSVSDAPR